MLIQEHDELRARDPSDPTLPDLNNRISDSIRASSRQAWRNKVESNTHKADPTKFWSLLKSTARIHTLPLTNPLSSEVKPSRRPRNCKKLSPPLSNGRLVRSYPSGLQSHRSPCFPHSIRSITPVRKLPSMVSTYLSASTPRSLG